MGTDPSRTKVTKEQRLARIRQNQRNCRERKRERVQALEKQVELLQDQRDEPLTANSDLISLSRRIDALVQENTHLRKVLQEISTLASSATGTPGFSHAALQPVPLSQSQAVAISSTVAKPISPVPFEVSVARGLSPSYGFSAGFLPNGMAPDMGNMFVDWSFGLESQNSPMPGEFDLSSHTPSLPGVPTDQISALNTLSPPQHLHPVPKPDSAHTVCLGTETEKEDGQIRSACNTACLNDVSHADVPAPEPATTMLCSIALQLVFKHNRKRLTMKELNERLRCGFRGAAEPEKGCRVENRVLFNVLAEICA